jgi:hypothetical protein
MTNNTRSNETYNQVITRHQMSLCQTLVYFTILVLGLFFTMHIPLGSRDFTLRVFKDEAGTTDWTAPFWMAFRICNSTLKHIPFIKGEDQWLGHDCLSSLFSSEKFRIIGIIISAILMTFMVRHTKRHFISIYIIPIVLLLETGAFPLFLHEGPVLGKWKHTCLTSHIPAYAAEMQKIEILDSMRYTSTFPGPVDFQLDKYNITESILVDIERCRGNAIEEYAEEILQYWEKSQIHLFITYGYFGLGLLEVIFYLLCDYTYISDIFCRKSRCLLSYRPKKCIKVFIVRILFLSLVIMSSIFMVVSRTYHSHSGLKCQIYMPYFNIKEYRYNSFPQFYPGMNWRISKQPHIMPCPICPNETHPFVILETLQCTCIPLQCISNLKCQ